MEDADCRLRHFLLLRDTSCANGSIERAEIHEKTRPGSNWRRRTREHGNKRGLSLGGGLSMSTLYFSIAPTSAHVAQPLADAEMY